MTEKCHKEHQGEREMRTKGSRGERENRVEGSDYWAKGQVEDCKCVAFTQDSQRFACKIRFLGFFFSAQADFEGVRITEDGK